MRAKLDKITKNAKFCQFSHFPSNLPRPRTGGVYTLDFQIFGIFHNEIYSSRNLGGSQQYLNTFLLFLLVMQMSVCLSVGIRLLSFCHNSVNFHAKTSRFCMEVDLDNIYKIMMMVMTIIMMMMLIMMIIICIRLLILP